MCRTSVLADLLTAEVCILPCHAVLCCSSRALQLSTSHHAIQLYLPAHINSSLGLNSDTYLAWYGERCGSSFNQVLWTGVYAFDKTTGARLPNCVKQRPAGGGAGDAQVAFWLGGCGTTPGALSSVPGRVCADPYICKSLSVVQPLCSLAALYQLSRVSVDAACVNP